MKDFYNKTMTIIATGFGLGYSPVAPGTVGTIWGVLIVLLLFPRIGLTAQIVASVVMTVVAVPICDAAEAVFKTKDDGRIVADEYLTFPICLIGLVGPDVGVRWWVVLVAFLTCRAFDIFKPAPAKQIQVLNGGLGIVADDVVASLYSLGTNFAIVFFVNKFIF